MGETVRFNVIMETPLSLHGVARVRCAVMDAACQNAYWWSAKTQFAVIRQLPSNYVGASAFLKPSNSNPSLFSEWLDHCPWQTGTKWAALCMLPLMFYWFALAYAPIQLTHSNTIALCTPGLTCPTWKLRYWNMLNVSPLLFPSPPENISPIDGSFRGSQTGNIRSPPA